MTGDCHVRFRESRRVKLLPATRQHDVRRLRWQFGTGLPVSGCCGGPVFVGDAAEDGAAADAVFGKVDWRGWFVFGLVWG